MMFPKVGFSDPFKTTAPPANPITELQSLLRTVSLDGDFMGKAKATTTVALSAIRNAPDSPTRKQRAHHVNATLTTIRGRFSAAPPSAAFHREAAKALERCQSLLTLITFLKRLRIDHPLPVRPHDIFPLVINLSHIVDGDENGGLHFCPPASPARAELRNIQVHPRTGVMCAEVPYDDGTKFSTLFPDTVATEDELVAVLTSGRPLARRQNETLFASTTDPQFHFLTRTNRQGMDLMTSAFPVFHYQRFRLGDTVDLATGMALTTDEVIRRREVQTGGAVLRFEYQSAGPRGIFDIAPLIHELPAVSQGILADVATGFIADPAPVATGPTLQIQEPDMT